MKTLLAQAKLYLILSLVSLAILLSDNLGLLKLPKALLQNVTLPIQYGLYRSGRAVLSQFSFIFEARYAAKQNKALRTQLADLLSENSNLRRRLSETEGALEQVNFLSPKVFNLIAARPVGLGRYLLIDKGSQDGLQNGLVVVFKDNYIGKIKILTTHSSQVMLLQDPDSKIAVFSQSKEGKAKGIVSGQFGSELLMDKILHSENISEEDIIYSEGSEGLLPRGLVIGKVTKIENRENELFKQAKVKPSLDISDLDIVFVISNP